MRQTKQYFFEALEEYAVNDDLRPFVEMLISCEEKELQEYLQRKR